MAQGKVTSYYSTRKRVHESKILRESSKDGIISNVSDKLKLHDGHVKEHIQVETTVADKKIKKASVGSASDSSERKAKNVTKKTEPKAKKAKPKTTNSRTGKGRLKGKSSEGEGNSDIRKVFQTQKEKNVVIKQDNEERTVIPKEETNEVCEDSPCKLVNDANIEKCTEVPCQRESVPTTPQPTLKVQSGEFEETSTTEIANNIRTVQSGEPSSMTTVPITPKQTIKDSECTVLTKEIKSATSQDVNLSPLNKQRTEDSDPQELGSPQKKARTMASSILPKEGSVILGRSPKQLDLATQSPSKKCPTQQSSKVNVTNLERSKFLNSGRLDTLKERLSKFDKSLSAQKEAERNKYKITSVISPGGSNSSQVEAKSADICRPTPSAYERFHGIVVPDAPSLTLPYKFKWLSEVFRCTDIVISMLHNRKEICSFSKLKNSVQEMTKRDFTKKYLGQIKAVFPLAYFYTQEKFHASSLINPKPGISRYQLVITPNLKTYREESNETMNENVMMQNQNSKANKNQSKNNVNKDPSHEKTFAPSSFVQMNPSILVERKKIFDAYLLKVVKKHHQDFLARLNPPITVPSDKLSRWHSKFPLDGVPDIQPSSLPEPIDVPKCHTAMDVLNKIKGTVSEKVEKALQIVADKSSLSTPTDKSKVDAKGMITSGVFKGISSDLLQRIRAREASKMVQEMTMPAEEKKRQQMMERLPEMVRIIRTYFITARKTAISMEDATQKVMDSYHSSLPQEDVKAHIQLLAEIFPKWLILVTISKGVFLKIDKNMDINIMLDSIIKK